MFRVKLIKSTAVVYLAWTRGTWVESTKLTSPAVVLINTNLFSTLKHRMTSLLNRCFFSHLIFFRLYFLMLFDCACGRGEGEPFIWPNWGMWKSKLLLLPWYGGCLAVVLSRKVEVYFGLMSRSRPAWVRVGQIETCSAISSVSELKWMYRSSNGPGPDLFALSQIARQAKAVRRTQHGYN